MEETNRRLKIIEEYKSNITIRVCKARKFGLGP